MFEVVALTLGLEGTHAAVELEWGKRLVVLLVPLPTKQARVFEGSERCSCMGEMGRKYIALIGLNHILLYKLTLYFFL